MNVIATPKKILSFFKRTFTTSMLSLFLLTSPVLLFAQPQFSACADIEFCGIQLDCHAKNALSNTISGNCNPAEALTVAFQIDLDNDGTDDYLGANISPFPFPNPNGLPILAMNYSDDDNDGTFDLLIDSLEYPIGTHRIQWTSSDACANTDTCSYLLEAKDCTPPTANPSIGSTFDLDPIDCAITVTGTMLDQGSWDDCCLASNPFRLRYPSLGPNQTTPPITTEVEFDYNDFGVRPVDFWVQDCHGNWTYELTYVIIQDPWGLCIDLSHIIAGNIQTWKGDPLNQVKVTLIGSNPTDSMETHTDTDGFYYFYTLASASGIITPEKDIDDRNGVSTLDLILISRHLVGLSELNSPYQLIAADADNSGVINTFDLITLQRLILYIDDVFTNNTSWRFVDTDYFFVDPKDPWSSPFPESIMFDQILGDNFNFTAIKIGDVNGNASTNLSAAAADDRTFYGDLLLQTEDLDLEPGEEYVLTFSLQEKQKMQELLGYQFTLDFEESAVELVDLADNKFDAQFGWSKKKEGILTAMWSSPTAVKIEEEEMGFSLKIKAKSKARLSDVLQLNAYYTTAEAYNGALELMSIQLDFTESEKPAAAEFSLYQNQPNPFSKRTAIRFYLPEAGKVTLRIFDSGGNLIQTLQKDYDQGFQNLELQKGDKFSNGIYYYQLQTAKATETRKMVVLE